MIQIKKIADDNFQLIDVDLDNKVIHTFNKCGLLMDSALSIPFKWGDYGICEKEFERFTNILPFEISKDVVLLDVSILDQDELDKMVGICDYCGKIYKKIISKSNE